MFLHRSYLPYQNCGKKSCGPIFLNLTVCCLPFRVFSFQRSWQPNFQGQSKSKCLMIPGPLSHTWVVERILILITFHLHKAEFQFTHSIGPCIFSSELAQHIPYWAPTNHISSIVLRSNFLFIKKKKSSNIFFFDNNWFHYCNCLLSSSSFLFYF